MLSYRHFKKVPSGTGSNSKTTFVRQYNGRSVVVITETALFCMDYLMKAQRLTVSFFVQRYTSDDYAIDSSLQALMNQ